MNDVSVFFVRARSWGKFAAHVFLSVGGTNFANGACIIKSVSRWGGKGGQVFHRGQCGTSPKNMIIKIWSKHTSNICLVDLFAKMVVQMIVDFDGYLDNFCCNHLVVIELLQVGIWCTWGTWVICKPPFLEVLRLSDRQIIRHIPSGLWFSGLSLLLLMEEIQLSSFDILHLVVPPF